MPKAMIPKGNPRIVQKIEPCFSFKLRVSKCWPFPFFTATIARETQVHWNGLSLLVKHSSKKKGSDHLQRLM